jgi:hypothetical protein
MTATDTTAQTTRCQRPGCKGILRTPESVARGMSAACDRKVRQALAAEAERGGFSEDQRAKAEAAIRSGEVTALDHGLYGVPSSKNDGARYATDGVSCCCPAGACRHPRRCWHLLAALVMEVIAPRRKPAAPATAPLPVRETVPSDAIWAELEARGATGAEDFIPAF